MRNLNSILGVFLIASLLLSSCSGSSDSKTSSINLEEYLSSDGYQKRRDGLFYQRNTQTLITGTILDESEFRNDYFEGYNYTYINRYFLVKDGLLNGKAIKLVHFSDDMNELRRGFGKPTADEPTLLEEINYKDGVVSGKVKLFSLVGDILVEGQAEGGKRTGNWQIFDGNRMITVVFSNNAYSLPEGTELEDDVKDFIDRKWDKDINEFY
jgi:hypothetical protein